MNESFKKYKNKEKPPDLKNVVDCSEKDDDKITKIELNGQIPKIGLIPPVHWKVYKLKDRPGLYVVKNPFTSAGQRYWIRKLVKEYTKYPNLNNLLPARFNEKIIKNFWEALNNESDESQRRLMKKSMRWSTLGYHYDWTNKIYDENFKNEFPSELHRLVATIGDQLNFKNYKSEAAIINFYPIGSTLSAHTDHSEFHLESPLFSISFGQSAIFLIGGLDREEEATPILLSSGDVLVMAKESRLCFHAVPRVFKCDHHSWNDDKQVTQCTDLNQNEVQECLKDEYWKPFESYLTDCRINVNVRQVNE